MADLTNETFGGTWPYKPQFYEHDGVKLHYVDEGEGDPIVMLHGNPTWGYLYRNFSPALSRTNRCVVPDHMGSASRTSRWTSSTRWRGTSRTLRR